MQTCAKSIARKALRSDARGTRWISGIAQIRAAPAIPTAPTAAIGGRTTTMAPINRPKKAMDAPSPPKRAACVKLIRPAPRGFGGSRASAGADARRAPRSDADSPDTPGMADSAPQFNH